MYKIKVVEQIKIKHKLITTYSCNENEEHEHFWKVEVECETDTLNINNKVADSETIRLLIKKFNGKTLNDYLYNPTEEEFLKNLIDIIPNCKKIKITNENNIEYSLIK